MGTFSSNILPAATGEDLGSPAQSWDLFAQNITASGTITGPISSSSGSFQKLNNVRFADQFAGADAGAKIIAAIADLPSTGGVVDARGFEGTQSISSTITIGGNGKPVTLLLNPATSYQPSSSSMTMFTVNQMGRLVDANISLATSFTGKVVLFSDLYTDGNHTGIDGLHISAVNNVSGYGIYLSASDGTTQFISYLSIRRVRCFGLKRLIYGTTTSTGFINGNHFQDIAVSDPQSAIEFNAGGGAIDGNVFTNLSIQSGPNTTQGILFNAPGLVQKNLFNGLVIWDSTLITPIQNNNTAGKNVFFGRVDGTSSYAATDVVLNNNTTNGTYAFQGGDVSAGSLDVPTANGQIGLGLNTSANTPVVNFRSSTNGNSFDSRIIASGGAPGIGNGTLSVQANTFATNFITSMAAGKTIFDNSGKLTNYNSVVTAGNGVSSIHGATSQKAETAADTNVLTFTPPAAAGTYKVSFVLSLSAANAATLGWTMTWKDSNGAAQSPTNLTLTQTGVAAPALTYTTSSAGNYHGTAIIDVDNSATAVVVKLTFSGTSFAGKASAVVERLQ